MILKIFEPPRPLGLFVKSLIYYQGYTAKAAFEQLIPDGHAQLIITLDEQVRTLKQVNDAGDLNLQATWISGVQSRPVTYIGEQNASTLCIQFAPGGLYAFTGIPTVEFHNHFVEISGDLRGDLAGLREQLMALPTPDAILQQASGFLREKILTNARDNYFEAFVHQQLCLYKNTLAETSQKTGYSQRHFIHLFKQKMGISPKKYQRLQRFQQVLLHLYQAPDTPFVELAHQYHFYDQAHLINEFKHFTQLTPGQYLQAERPYAHVVASNVRVK